jgi:hypothetical protein
MYNKDMEATTAQIERTTREWSQIASEPVRVEQIRGAMYAYGSELACLRLYRKFNGAPNVTSAYSANMQTWFFRVETDF